MSLLGNYTVLNKNPGRFYSGPTIAQTRANFNNSSSLRNSNMHWGKLVSIPLGYSSPDAFFMPQSVGGLSSFTSNIGSISTNAMLALGQNIDASLTASISENMQLDVLAKISSSITGSMSITNGDLLTLTQIALSMNASGAISNADIKVIAGIFLQSSMSASVLISNGDLTYPNIPLDVNLSAAIAITSAQLDAVTNLVANMSASISLNATSHTNAFISSDIGGPAPLTPEGLANAVWAKNISDYVAPSAGDTLNNASAAGNPWSALLTSNNTVGTFGYLVQKLLTVAKFLGLK